MPPEVVLDVLTAWALTVAGSRVAWARGRGGTLLRPVQRTLAACTTVTVGELRDGLRRARSASAPAIVPAPETLRAWAQEYPFTRVLPDGRVSLSQPLSAAARTRLLLPSDRIIIRALRTAGTPLTRAALSNRILRAGVSSSPGEAKVAVYTAAFLTPVSRYEVTLAGQPNLTGRS